MGADGHIAIYDLKEIRKEVTNDELNFILGSQVYIQMFLGNEYLTNYFGDNICFSAEDWSDVYGFVSKDSPYWISMEDFNSIWDRVRKHKITTWEVWT